MGSELAAEIARIFHQRPDLLRSLVRLAIRQHVAFVKRRRKESALAHLTVDDFDESEVHIDPFESRAERLCALATGADRERLRDVAVDVVHVLLDEPGLSLRQLRKAVREARGSCADGDVDAAVVYLGAGISWEEGPRSARLHTVNVLMLPADVRKRLGVSE
jgi:hypothetical protein